MLAAAQDIGQELRCSSSVNLQRRIEQHFGEADDRVERRAQLVRHVGEKLRFVAIGRLDLPAFVFDFAKQPGILDRQDGLRGEGFHQIDHLGTKLAGGFSPHDQGADDALFAQQGNGQARAKTIALQDLAHARRVNARLRNIGNLNRLAARCGATHHAVAKTRRICPQSGYQFFFHMIGGAQQELFADCSSYS